MPLDVPVIYDRLTAVFRDVFDDDSVTPAATTTAADIPDWDSLAHIRLIVAVEKAFSVRFSAAEAGGMKNVGEFVEMIRRKAA
jgi:acyl carrier protein